MAGHSRPKDGVLSHAYVPAIHVLVLDATTKDVDARHKAGHDARTDGTANYCCGVFFTNIALILSNSSILAPCLRMITLCCTTESRLFQAQ